MSEDTKEYIGLAVIAIGLMFLTFIVTQQSVTDSIRLEAISAGVAEHYIDADQNKAFRWKTNHVLESK
jgi:hypothetical protein